MLGGILQDFEALPRGGILQEAQVIGILHLVKKKFLTLQLVLILLQILAFGPAVVHGLGRIVEQPLVAGKPDMAVIMGP
ncbi:hypothetical protein D3C76_1537680 [compost metagenome]